MKNSYKRDYIINYNAIKPSQVKTTVPKAWKRMEKALLKRCKEADEPGYHVAYKTICISGDSYVKRIGVCLFCGQWFQGAPFNGYNISYDNAISQMKREHKKHD